MGGTQAGSTNRGNQADYLLGTSEGWDAFGVVRWHGIEEISRPFLYDITLTRDASGGPVNLDTLLDTGASFAIHGQSGWRMVHGILAEAAEIDQTSTTILYRVLLVPHVWHARCRSRCRNFLKKTLFQIVSAVLENRSPAHPAGLGGLTLYTDAQAVDQNPVFTSFTPATATYRWDVKDRDRIDDLRAYHYVAQYNESDFAFLSRLLEGEGLSYYFEQGRDQVVLAITDVPGASPAFDTDPTFELHRTNLTGVSQGQEILRSFYDVRRMRSRVVTMRDWDYYRSQGPLQASVSEATGDPDLVNHFEFPAGEESILVNPGQHAVDIRLERYDVERAMHEGSSTVHTMVPGYRFTLHDKDNMIADTSLLAVRVETYATARALQGTLLDELPFGFAHTTGALTVGFDGRFLALDATIPFRPAMRTPKPRIHGVQAAVVTAEEYPEGERPVINGDNQGRVRVRFPWDQRDDKNDKTPTSRWIRVSQFWAGAGYGALYTPRVGHEVLVAYMQGDPDQPVIVGRVYNATHTPPYEADADPTKSTVKSQSAEQKAEVDGFNEIRFEDRKGQEEIYLHAQQSLNEVVLGSHSTSVGGDQTNTVWRHQYNTVHGHREHTILDYEKVTVVADRTTSFQANEHHMVTGFRDTTIGANESLLVGGFRSTVIGANEMLGVVGFRNTIVLANDDRFVAGWNNRVVGGGETIDVTADRSVSVHANQSFKTAGNLTSESTNAYFYPHGDFQVDSTTAGFNQTASFYVKAGSASISMSSGIIMIDNGAGSLISMIGGLVAIYAGAGLSLSTSGSWTGEGGEIGLVTKGDINAVAANIKLNG